MARERSKGPRLTYRRGRVLVPLLCLAVIGCGLALWWMQQAQTIFPSRDVIWEQTQARFDKNGDGLLSAEEYAPFTLPADPKGLRFSDYDLDEDGVITSVELAEQLTTREPRPLVDNRTVKRAYTGKNFGHSQGVQKFNMEQYVRKEREGRVP